MTDKFMDSLRVRDDNTDHFKFQLSESDVIVEGDQVKFLTHDGEFVLTETSFRQICEHVGIPTPYARRIDDELLQQNFNYLLQHSGDAQFALISEDFRVRSFKDPTFPYVSSYDLYRTITDQIDSGYNVKYSGMNDHMIQAIILPNDLEDVVGGSKVAGGVKFNHADSWLGTVPISFDAFLHRELGDTGMTVKITDRRFRVSGKSEGEILKQGVEFAHTALALVPDMIEGYKKTVEEPVDHPELLIRRICREDKVPKKVTEKVVYWLNNPLFLETVDGKVNTMFDVINAFQFTGTHDSDLSHDNSELLLDIAGNLAINHHARCVDCGQIVE
jgi:hypothetical protein